MDLCGRKMVGVAMGSRMTKQLVMDALQDAINHTNNIEGCILHSDRGSQYCSHDYQKLLRGYGMAASMSRKGNCWDNAVSESFFGRLKTEEVYRNFYKSQMDARDAIFSFIEIFFNKQRRNSAIGYHTPEEKIELVETVA